MFAKCSATTSGDEVRFGSLIDWERRIRDRRPEVPDEVREHAYDKAIDALIDDPALGCDEAGVPSASVTGGLANQCLRWKIAEDLRARLTPDGMPRSSPRAARSLDAAAYKHGDGQTARVGERVPSPGDDVAEIVHYRLQLAELHRRVAAAGALTRDAILGYEFGSDPRDIAAVHAVGINAVHQAKSRFIRRHQDLAS